MKLVDVLKQLFGDELEDVDAKKLEEIKKQEDDKEDNKKNDEPDDEAEKKTSKLNNLSNNKDNTEKKEDKTVKIPTFNKETGLFDIDSTDSEELKSVLKIANNSFIERENNTKINTAINEKLAGLKIRKGITVDAVKTLINKSDISVDGEGNIIGLDEAIENLKTEQSGLFVQRNGAESSPVLEGYNPSDNDTSSMLDSALASLSESLK